jgi:hypothetical protein
MSHWLSDYLTTRNWNSLLGPDREPSLEPLQVPGSLFFILTETYFYFSYAHWESRQTNHYCHLLSHMKDTINRPLIISSIQIVIK